jgi:hypothetical protein
VARPCFRGFGECLTAGCTMMLRLGAPRHWCRAVCAARPLACACLEQGQAST